MPLETVTPMEAVRFGDLDLLLTQIRRNGATMDLRQLQVLRDYCLFFGRPKFAKMVEEYMAAKYA